MPPIPIPIEPDKKIPLNERIFIESSGWLEVDEAEVYFNHLVAIVTETKKPTEVDVEQAYNELFHAINSMRPDIVLHEDIFGSMNKEIVSLKDEAADLKEVVGKLVLAIEGIDKWIARWTEDYEPTIKEAKKDYESKLGKIRKSN